MHGCRKHNEGVEQSMFRWLKTQGATRFLTAIATVLVLGALTTGLASAADPLPGARQLSPAVANQEIEHLVFATGVMDEMAEEGATAEEQEREANPRFMLFALGNAEGKARGNLKFVVPGQWRYNGAVREVTVEGNTATIKGRGAIVELDGTRKPVTFTATATEGQPGTFTITIKGVDNDFEYTCDAPLVRGRVFVE